VSRRSTGHVVVAQVERVQFAACCKRQSIGREYRFEDVPQLHFSVTLRELIE
jgi:hypothetical protein